MERTIRIPNDVQSIGQLSSAVEACLDEIFFLLSTPTIPQSQTSNPQAGGMLYDDDADQLYIYNKAQGAYLPH